MSDLLDIGPARHERLTIPTIWIAFMLSLVLHLAGLLGWTHKPFVPFAEPKLGQPSGTLAIRLVPNTAPPLVERTTRQPTAPPTVKKSPPVAHAAIPRTLPAPAPPKPAQPSPPVMTFEAPRLIAPPSVAPQPAPPAPGEDLAAYIASRRRAREGPSAPPAQPAETEQEKHNRIVAENLGLTSTPTFGNDPDRGGGVFQIRSLGYDIGEFAFFGWNKDINRNSLQVVEVRRGNNANMEIAMVRRMIVLIRERSSGDFLWQSRRQGRGVWLSARPADTAELEAFIMRELFPEPKPRQ